MKQEELRALLIEFLGTLPKYDQLLRELTGDARITVGYIIADPDEAVILDFTGPVMTVRREEGMPRCTVILKARAADLHLVLLGELPFSRALYDKRVLVRGSSAKLAQFFPLLKMSPILYQDFYSFHMRAQGRREDDMSRIRNWADRLGDALSLERRPRAGQAVIDGARKAGYWMGYAMGFAKSHVLRDLKLEDLMGAMSSGLSAGKGDKEG